MKDESRAVRGMEPALQRVRDLADGTRSRADVALQLGIKPGTLRVYCARLRELGAQPAFAGETRRGRVPAGYVRVTVGLQLPTDVAEWIDRQTPKGATAADLVRAIILDAFNEEVGQ